MSEFIRVSFDSRYEELCTRKLLRKLGINHWLVDSDYDMLVEVNNGN